MAYNIIKGRVEFSNSATGSIESLVDDWRTQAIGGVKTFTSTVSASAFWDTTAGGEVRALKSLIASDGANRVLTSDGDGTLTAHDDIAVMGNQLRASSVHITGSTFSGSAHGITGIILNPDHLATTNYDGLANRLSASNIVLGLGMSSSVDGAQLQVTGGQGITVDTEGTRVLTASNGGLAFTGQTLQVDPSITTNKGGGPSSADEFVIADNGNAASIKNLTYSQIKTAITDSISVPITSYTNNGNNRVVTSVNSTTVNGEANLLFDGTTLAVSGAGSGQRGSFSVSGTADMPLFFVDGFQKRVAINNDAPGVTFQVTDRTAAPIVGIHRSASSWYSDGDDIGDVAFAASALGATYGISARIRAEADGSEWNSTSYPSRLTLWTSATGSSSPTQRMIINNSGNVGIATATPTHRLTVAGTVSASLAVSALSFTGDGSGLTGVTGEWDGTHNGNAEITGALIVTNTLSASNGLRGLNVVLDAGGTGKIGVTGDTGLMTLTANTVAVGGAVNSTTLSASSTVNLVGPTNFGKENQTTISDVGALSSSLTTTIWKGDFDRIVVGSADIDHGSIDNTSIGTSTQSTGKFTTLSASNTTDLASGVNLGKENQTTVSSVGILSSSATATLYNATLDRITAGTADINGGTIDGATVGANSQAAGNFTTLSASSTVDLVGATRFGKENQTTVSNIGVLSSSAAATVEGAWSFGKGAQTTVSAVGVLSSSATATLANITLDRITVASADINGGNIDGAVIGAASAAAGTFLTVSASSTLQAAGVVTLGNGKTSVSAEGILSSSATATLANATLDRITAGTADINGGNIDGTVIGAASAAAGTFLTVSASSTLQAAGVVTLGNGKTTVSAEGVLSSSATATLANATLDKITLQEISTVPGGGGSLELLGGLNTTSYITSSGGIHATGSSPRLAIGDKGGVGPQDGMLFIRPSDTSNKVLALFQAAEADGQRTCFGVTGSGQVLVGGLHLGGVLNVSGSDDEKLISTKSNTLDPAFYVSGSGDMFVGRSTYLSGAVQQNYVVKSTPADTYISGATDRVAIYTLSSPHNAYLPTLNDSLNGLTITVKSVGSAAVTVTGSVLTNQLIDGNANKVLEQGDAVTLLGYNGAAGYEWVILDYFDAA